MGVGSFLEVYTTVFGWLLYDNVWSILSETGLAYIPFFTVVIKNFAEPYKSQEAKDAASVSQRRMELDIISMFIVVIIVVSPYMNLSLGSQSYKNACSAGPAVVGGATGTTYDTSFTTTALGGAVAKVPIWWYMVMNLSGAINDSVIAGINCSVNVRQVKYEINNLQISDQGLKDDLSRFHNECYLEALATVSENPNAWQNTFNAGGYDVDDREWVGSKFFIADSALYSSIRAKTPVTGFTFDASRDSEYDTTVATPSNGRPSCKEWWSDSSNGLLKRLNTEVPASKNAELSAFGSLFGNSLAKERENAIKTVLLNSSVATDSMDRMVLNGLDVAGEPGVLVSLGKRALAGATALAAWGFVETSLIAMQNILPTLQALILMTTYFLLPFILVMAGYGWGAVIVATFAIFSIKFLTTIYAVLLYLDSKMYSAINQPSLNAIFSSADTMTLGALYADLSIAIMWVVMPSVWIGMIAWAGVKVGSGVGSATTETKNTGDRGTQGASGAAKKF